MKPLGFYSAFFTASVAVHTLAWVGFEGRFGSNQDTFLVHNAVVIENVYPSLAKASVEDRSLARSADIPKILKGAKEERSLDKVKDSAELLRDPERGAAFLNYFGLVKFKITREVQKKHAAFHVAEGSVRLFFILRPNGSLERVWTLAEEASTNEVARLFAMECVRQASPFMPFPKSLGKEKICFQATVYF